MTQTLFDQLPQLQAELAAVEDLLQAELRGGNAIQQAAGALVLGGGKRLRPAMVLAAAFCGGYDPRTALPTAAAIEVLHAATLAHDDVVDEAGTRRGKPTLHHAHGNHVAIYAGDYLLAKAMKLLSRSDLPTAEVHRVSAAIETLCMGEVAQYLGRGAVPGLREYLKRILGKTGVLFAAACAIGARCGKLPDEHIDHLWKAGLRFGAAFQIRDDLLDVERDAAAGKPTAHDLLEGVVTLPVLLAAQDAAYRLSLEGFLHGQRDKTAAVGLLERARQLGGNTQTRAMLAAQLDRGEQHLRKLPDSPGRAMLLSINGMLRQ